MDLKKLSTELKIRGYSDKTIRTYLMQNRLFLTYNKKDVDVVTEDDVKEYIGYLLSEKKHTSASVGLTLSAIKFYFHDVLKRKIIDDIKTPKKEKKLPVVFSKSEINSLINSVSNHKHKLLITLLYSSGLRVSEAVSLRVSDLDLEDKTGIIRSGKGKKDRNIILSSKFISDLKEYIEGKEVDYIFSVKNKPITTRQAQKIVTKAASLAGIKKRVFCHALRSSFATHLLENGTDIRLIQVLLGHSNLSTTERYTKVSKEQIKKVKNPFDE